MYKVILNNQTDSEHATEQAAWLRIRALSKTGANPFLEYTLKTGCDGEGCEEPECQDCCDHEPDSSEGYHCSNCGKDCSEGVASAAYDRAKDIRKYGA